MKVLETERLILRHQGIEDVEFIFTLVNDSSWLRFIGDRGVRTLQDARDYIRKGAMESYARHGFGLYLTDEKDRTLYAFDKDSKDTSTCTGGCATTWPPYIVSAKPQAAQGINATLISTFTRADGTTQGQYDTHPLYYYSIDKNPGDFKGHNVGGVWHVLSPRGSTMTNAAPSAVPTP